MNRIKTGFTLIELLVVISIIGILSAVIYANFSDARIDARNKALMSEFRETQLALEVYKAQTGGYPVQSMGVTYDDLLTPEYIAEVPSESDSSNPNCTIEYSFDASYGDWYKLTGVNCFGGADTAAEGIQPNSEFARCPSYCADCDGVAINPGYLASDDFYESIAVYSAGGQCE